MRNEPIVTLDRPERYRITVEGQLNEGSTLLQSTRFTVNEGVNDTTTLVGTVDQAGLQGTLRALYRLGMPIISVNCVRKSRKGDG